VVDGTGLESRFNPYRPVHAGDGQSCFLGPFASLVGPPSTPFPSCPCPSGGNSGGNFSLDDVEVLAAGERALMGG
jgi:hypothetical protein